MARSRRYDVMRVIRTWERGPLRPLREHQTIFRTHNSETRDEHLTGAPGLQSWGLPAGGAVDERRRHGCAGQTICHTLD